MFAGAHNVVHRINMLRHAAVHRLRFDGIGFVIDSV
jgi:hypothetical protein